jgi:hypothetical protein
MFMYRYAVAPGGTLKGLYRDMLLHPGLEIREYGCGDPLRLPRDTLYPQTFALTSRTSGGRSVGIVHSRTKVTELFYAVKQGGTLRGLCRDMLLYVLGGTLRGLCMDMLLH